MTWEHWIVTAIVLGAATWLIRTAIVTVRAGLDPHEASPGCAGCPGKNASSSQRSSLVTKPLVQIGGGIPAKSEANDIRSINNDA